MLYFAFLLTIAFNFVIRIWLVKRHVRHIESHRSAVPTNFSEKIPLPAHQKAADYSIAKTQLSSIETIFETAILLALTLGGGIEWLSKIAVRTFDAPLAQGVAIIAAVGVLTGLLDLPFRLYRTFVIEQRFGFNRITPRLFITDLLKETLVGAAILLPVLAVVLWLMRRAGDHWWLYAWAFWVGVQLLMLAIYPTFIAPLFNRFTPLDDVTLRERIERLLARCGFRSSGLFVMDGSKRSNHGNAYFTGFGQTKRIVFFDTLLKRLSGDEIEAVLAHELGHFKRRHLLKRMAWTFALSLALLALLGALMGQPWFYAGLGVPLAADAPREAIALLLFFLALPVFAFPLSPLLHHYSRRHEFEADAYAAEQASASMLIQALVKLYEDNASTLTPDPLYSAFYDSHPPATIRIARLQTV